MVYPGIRDMTGFFIEPRSRGRTEQLESKLRHVTEGWVSRAGDFASPDTVTDTPLFPTCAHSYLGTIFATPPPKGVICADDDEMGLGSSCNAVRRRTLVWMMPTYGALHALLEDIACRVELLTVATAQLFHTHQPDPTSTTDTPSTSSAGRRSSRWARCGRSGR
jgi:hypothetical protein